MNDSTKLPKEFLLSINIVKTYFHGNGLFDYNIIIKPEPPYLVIENSNSSSYFSIKNFSQNAYGGIYTHYTYKSPLHNSEEISSLIEYGNILEAYSEWLEQLKKYEEFIELHDSLFAVSLVKKTTTDYSLLSQNLLPICLKQLQVRSYFGIQYTEIIDIPENAQWVFLIGENGFGKTLLLQSIFLGLYGNKDNDTTLANNEQYDILTELNNGANRNLVNVLRFSNNNGSSIENPLSKIVAIGASRLNLANESASDLERKSAASYSLFNTDGFLLNLDAELAKYAFKKDDKYEIIRTALINLLQPYISKIEYSENEDAIFYFEKDEEDNKYKPVKYKDLASGFKSIIGIAGDIIIRLIKHQSIDIMADLEGIVLIDEFDLHWHPKWQIELVKSFTKVFPKIQFIVSTHSPMPLLGAPLTSQVYKVCRNKEQGVFVEKMEVNLKVLTPNLILTSPIFDLDNIANIHADIDEVEVEDDYEELEKNKKIDELLSNTDALKKKYPDSIFQ